MLGRAYVAVARPIIRSKARAWIFLLLVGIATLASLSLFYTRDVTVKLLPFDNKSELQVVLDMPEGTSLEATGRALSDAAGKTKASLARLRGAAFDKAYVANEVAFHQQVNGALQTLLIPSASNPELKGLLETGLKIFQGHEQHAVHVAAELR